MENKSKFKLAIHCLETDASDIFRVKLNNRLNLHLNPNPLRVLATTYVQEMANSYSLFSKLTRLIQLAKSHDGNYGVVHVNYHDVIWVYGRALLSENEFEILADLTQWITKEAYSPDYHIYLNSMPGDLLGLIQENPHPIYPASISIKQTKLLCQYMNEQYELAASYKKMQIIYDPATQEFPINEALQNVRNLV